MEKFDRSALAHDLRATEKKERVGKLEAARETVEYRRAEFEHIEKNREGQAKKAEEEAAAAAKRAAEIRRSLASMREERVAEDRLNAQRDETVHKVRGGYVPTDSERAQLRRRTEYGVEVDAREELAGAMEAGSVELKKSARPFFGRVADVFSGRRAGGFFGALSHIFVGGALEKDRAELGAEHLRRAAWDERVSKQQEEMRAAAARQEEINEQVRKLSQIELSGPAPAVTRSARRQKGILDEEKTHDSLVPPPVANPVPPQPPRFNS